MSATCDRLASRPSRWFSSDRLLFPGGFPNKTGPGAISGDQALTTVALSYVPKLSLARPVGRVGNAGGCVARGPSPSGRVVV